MQNGFPPGATCQTMIKYDIIRKNIYLNKQKEGAEVAMKKLIIRMYGVAGILFFFLFLYGLFNLRINIDRSDALNHFTKLSNYSVSTVNDIAAPAGEKKIIRFRLRDIKGDNNTLLFRSDYQKVKVFVENKLIYGLETAERFLCPKNPGVIYNEITLKPEYNNLEIRIELQPYFDGIDPTPSLRMGERSAIIADVILSNLLGLILCSIIIFMGVIQFGVAVINRKSDNFGSAPAMFHACFIFLIGMWKIMGSDAMALFSKDYPLISQFSFFILALVPLMLTKTVRDQLGVKKEKWWLIADVVSLTGIIVFVGLQLAGILEFYDGIWILQACLIFAFFCILFSLRGEVKNSGWTKENKTAVIVTCFSFIWLLVDMIFNYATNGVSTMPFSSFLFLVFLVILVWNRMKISRKGMEEGMQARQYKKLAFHDALTGFFNRAAYLEYLSSPEFSKEDSVMLAFDLNNLKKCNDELGHDKGDIYIKESAKIILDCFGESGRCYRLGGDEFSAILEKTTAEECEKCIKRMLDRVERFNQASRDIRMGIACGYAVFDPKEDEDIHATIRRADKMMYEMKFAMKQTARG